MTGWLDPVRRTLDSASAPVTFFFRDDDAGWEDERLLQLLGLFEDYGLPLDLAVIPLALTEALARQIAERVAAQPQLIGVHQHGFAHINHETEGRKCEFGPTRAAALQERDIRRGKYLLDELLGPMVQPIFTPPWNRCGAQTGDCLIRLGFRALSRDRSVEPLGLPGLVELPIQVDWLAKSKGVPLTREQIGRLIAERVEESKPVGVMFHHAVMDEDEREAAGELLSLLSSHNQAQCRLMHALVADQADSGFSFQSHSGGYPQS
jgi:peptidoglycan/xylan/chitin deacetylase (PgdA/CDA1 family)